MGLQKLCRLATGMANLNTDLLAKAEQAKASGDMPGYLRAMQQIANKVSLSPAIQRDVLQHGSAMVIDEMEEHIKVLRAKLTHRARIDRYKAESFRPKFRLFEIEEAFPVEFFLVQCWLRFPNGPWPGLMFWSNKAIAKWFFATAGPDTKSFSNLGRDYIKKTRQRLGLIPVSDKSPWVWDLEVRRLVNRDFEVTCRNRKREIIFVGKKVRLC
jgi:hypothetical protein